MKYLLFLFPLLLSAQTPSRVSHRDSTRWRSQGYVKTTQPTNELLFLTVKINNKDAILLIDTGSSGSIIDINQLQHFQLKAERITDAVFSGVGGKTTVSKVINLPTIKIHTTQYAANFLATDLTNVRNTINKTNKLLIAGILGSDFFQYHKVVIDYNRNLIIFRNSVATQFHRGKSK